MTAGFCAEGGQAERLRQGATGHCSPEGNMSVRLRVSGESEGTRCHARTRRPRLLEGIPGEQLRAQREDTDLRCCSLRTRSSAIGGQEGGTHPALTKLHRCVQRHVMRTSEPLTTTRLTLHRSSPLWLVGTHRARRPPFPVGCVLYVDLQGNAVSAGQLVCSAFDTCITAPAA